MFGLPLEVITMLMSTVGGAFLKMWSQSSEDKQRQNEMLLQMNNVHATAVNDARAYKNPNAAWIRRFLVVSFMGMAAFILLAPMFGMNTTVPIEVTEGFKFLFLDFTTTVTEYITLEGIVTPDWLGHAILSVVGMYFGSSIVNRR
jgi:uncharacterized membrane protein YfcA